VNNVLAVIIATAVAIQEIEDLRQWMTKVLPPQQTANI